ncbi:MAG: NBR1-Ig-like domain-containing protein [Patescibacteria group bacterium]|jgi:hypothetical protein
MILSLTKGQEARRFFVRTVGFIVVCFFVLAKGASAVTIVQKSQVNLAPGEVKTISVSIKNQTASTWYGGATKISLYLYGSSSVLKYSTWLKNDLPATIAQASVKPGATATATFKVKAPSTPGTYVEMFLLGNGKVWQQKTVVQITFKVTAPTPAPVVTTDQGYKAEILDKGGLEWQTDPDAHLALKLKVKNTGTAAWLNSSSAPLILYSPSGTFKDMSWISTNQVAAYTQKVLPGQTIELAYELRGPQVPGSYNETFELKTGSISITGGSYTLPIKVRTPDNYVVNPNSNGQTSLIYAALLLLKPRGPFTVSGNATLDLQYGIKNIGTAIWSKYAIRLKEIAPNLGTSLSGVKHDSWPASDQATLGSTVTEPGRLDLIGFKVKAPAKKGSYTVTFALEADGKEVDGGTIEIPITVTADGYIEPEPVTPPAGYIPPTDTSNLPNEPIIRVGIYATVDDTLMVRGVQGGYSLQQNGAAVCTFNQADITTVKFDRANKVYKVSGPNCNTQSTNYYVAVAADGLAPLEVTDISRPVSWLPGANDNKFRAKLELRYTPSSDKVWVINELPIEYYLKGIAETSDVSPMEFQKTLLVAARTYAMYHVERATKHASEYYIVDAKYDQVYRGYGQEARSPSIVSAVEQTRGIVVTYANKIAITPYFSRSDGRTRDWSEVWGGEVAWCKGVSVPQDAGKTLWGHGVGLSASGALQMAAHENKTYDQILKYFYTGIELKPWYK